MLVQLGILCVFACVAIVASYYFFRKKILLQNAHQSLVYGLETDIEWHQKQLLNRDENLNKYHFLRYNLSDALVEQPNIRV